MALPTLSGAGRLTADPELRYSKAGKAVATVPLAFNRPRKNPETDQWEDGDVLFVRGTLFGEVAESAADHLRKGMEVVVVAQPKTDQWTNKEGEKRSAVAMYLDAIGPAITRKQSVTVAKADSPQPRQQQKAEPDPWASEEPAPF